MGAVHRRPRGVGGRKKAAPPSKDEGHDLGAFELTSRKGMCRFVALSLEACYAPNGGGGGSNVKEKDTYAREPLASDTPAVQWKAGLAQDEEQSRLDAEEDDLERLEEEELARQVSMVWYGIVWYGRGL